MVVINYVTLKQKDYLGLFRKARHNHKFLKGGGGEMTQRVKMLVVKPDNLSLIPRTHMVEERTNSSKLSSDLHIYATAGGGGRGERGREREKAYF